MVGARDPLDVLLDIKRAKYANDTAIALTHGLTFDPHNYQHFGVWPWLAALSGMQDPMGKGAHTLLMRYSSSSRDLVRKINDEAATLRTLPGQLIRAHMAVGHPGKLKRWNDMLVLAPADMRKTDRAKRDFLAARCEALMALPNIQGLEVFGYGRRGPCSFHRAPSAPRDSRGRFVQGVCEHPTTT